MAEEIAELRHVRERLADEMCAGGSVEIRDATLAERDPEEIREVMAQLHVMAMNRGLFVDVMRDPVRYVTIVRWSPRPVDGRLPVDPPATPSTYRPIDHSPSYDEPRSSGWSS